MRRRARWLALGLLYAALLIGGWYAGGRLDGLAAVEVLPQTEARLHRGVMTASAAFVLASATPFVPGAEIGFALPLLFGAKIAPLVYLSMVAALTLAFAAGRLVPASATARAFDAFGFARARDLALRFGGLEPSERLSLLLEAAPARIAPVLLRHRCLALIVLLNLPGNSVPGGGGGIAFAAGLSGLFSFPRYLLAVLAAVAPFPLYVALAGRFG